MVDRVLKKVLFPYVREEQKEGDQGRNYWSTKARLVV